MLKRILSGILLMIFSVGLASAQAASIPSGINWLISNQNSDSSWGNVSSSAAQFTSTAETLEALRVNVNTGTSFQNGLAWLNAQSLNDNNFTSARLQIRVRSGLDNTADLSTLIDGKNSIENAWGLDSDYTNDSLNTASALKALKAANYSDQTIIFPAISFLLSIQNPDGGWGFTQDDDSNVFVTAQVVSVLAQYNGIYMTNTQLATAAAFLLSKQNPDGGFGIGASTVYETALAFIAITESGQGQTLPLQNALNYLTTNQSINGSWNDDPYSTALALQALSQVKADLSISAANIVATPASPTVGNSLTVTATARNIGLETSGITVRLLDNGIIVGDQVISAIIPGGSMAVAFNIPNLTPAGEHVLSIILDPANNISGENKANNSATLRVWAKAAADLVVLPEYLNFTPAYPKPGESVTLTYQIANMGESSATNVTADLYNGDPANGGIKLGSATIASIEAGGTGTAIIAFNLAAAGNYSLYLVIDPLYTVTETSVTNNTAIKVLTVNASNGTGFIDLAIPMNGLKITPQRPKSGDTVTVTMQAANFGTEVATSDVELFNGDPASGGVLINKTSVTLNAGETRNIDVSWQIPNGISTLKAYIDRANLIAERDENNNSQSLTVMTDMVDLEVSASDIVIEPEHPMDGDAATVKMTVQNRGLKASGPFNVNLYNGDPANGGTLLQTFAVSNLAGDATQQLSHSFTASRGTYRFYVVCDPDNQVVEMYEDNNTAIRSLLVKTSAEAKGPDLVPLEFDLSATTTDPQSLRISGTATVKFQNKGDDKVATSFRVTVFEDKDNDGIYTEGTDLSLGFWDYNTPMNPNMVGVVSIPLSGTLTFRDAPIYAMVDSGQSVFEQKETNNSIRKGSDCENRPAKTIEPVLRWKWDTANDPTFGRILSTPVVISLNDDNGDGKIDNRDNPAILVNAWAANYQTLEGKLWAFDGKTGVPIIKRYVTGQAPYEGASPMVGDIDGDGKPEIIVGSKRSGEGMLVFNNDGSLKWDNSALVTAYRLANPFHHPGISEYSLPAIADLDGDGHTEIVFGRVIFNWDGSVRCAPDYRLGGGYGWTNGFGYSVSLADLDMDGQQEIIAGYTAYNNNCTIKWSNSSLPDGLTAIGNLDDDPYPEIVLMSSAAPLGSRVYLLDHNGNIKWGPVILSQIDGTLGSAYSSHPVIADFDGDGKPEIGIRGRNQLLILDQDGRLKLAISSPTGNLGHDTSPAPAVFDLDGDGRPEVLLNSGGYFRIFDGKDGALRIQEPTGFYSEYVSNNVVIADVDGDGHAEVVVTGNYGSGPMSGHLRVYGAKNNDWVNTRRIWNQASYHVTNINDDGSIPKYEAPSWLTNNNYRCQVPTSTGPNPYLASDISASFVRVDMAGYPSSVTVTARIGNGGAKSVDAGLKTAFHDGDPTSGGVLISTAVTSKVLNPGDYEDVIITWNNPVEGNHNISVTADSDNIVSECDKTNNVVTLPVFITSGRPDLSIVSEDIIIPASIPEGSLADITITVRNIGTLPVNNALVRLYAGNPASGGKQIRSDQIIPAIAAGGASSIKISWNTLGAHGTTYLYAAVDPNAVIVDSNRGNNSAIKEVLVTEAVKPDLQIAPEDISITPVSPSAGDLLNISVNIHNRGLATGNVKVALYNGNPSSGGKIAGTVTIPQIIQFGGFATATVTMDTVGLSGTIPLYAKVDPDNTIDELSKANNQASKSVTISPVGLNLGMTSDKPAYNAKENILFTISASELKAQARTFIYDLLILDKNGVQSAVALGDTPLSMGPSAALAFTATWNTGSTIGDSYTAIVRIKENGRIVAKANASFTILPSKIAGVAIVSDKANYGANEQVSITATVTGTSPNYIFNNISAKTTVLSGSGQILFTDSRNIASLTNGQRLDIKNYWNSADNPKGSYTLKLELFEGATPINSAQATFAIGGSADSGGSLTGSVVAQPTTIEAGLVENLSFNITNRGNEIISALTLQILIVDPDSGTAIKTVSAVSGALSLAINASQTGKITISTDGLPPKPLLAILQSSLLGITKTLASTTFIVTDTTPPVLTVSTLPNGTYTNNETMNIAGTVKDNTGIKELRINDAVVPVNSDGSFSYALILKAGANPVTITATDLGNNNSSDSRTINLDKAAPILTITTPSDNIKTAINLVNIAGTVDETSTVAVVIKNQPQAVTMNANVFIATVSLEPGYNTIEVTATDLAGNTSSQKRTVIYDDQKPSLAITEPAQDIRINKASLIVMGTVFDALTAVTITLAMENETFTADVINGAFQKEVVFTAEKSYAVVVTATNEAGSTTSVQRNIIYDITPPILTIDPVTSPTSQANQTVSGTRESEAPVTLTCSTATVGEVTYPTTTTWQTSITGLKDGDNLVTVTSSDTAGNVTTASATIKLVVVQPETTFAYAIFADKSITMSGGVYTDSYNGSPCGRVRGQYKKGSVGTNSLQSCSISLSGGVQVYGKALVGHGGNPSTGVCISGGSSVYNNSIGTLAEAKNMTPKSDPYGGTVMGALNLASDTKKTLSDGNYRFSSINLSGAAKLTLTGQVTLHVDGNLTVTGGASFVIASGATVTIYQNGQKINISGGAMVNNNQDPKKLVIYGTAGMKSIDLSGGTNLHALIYAPTADISISGGQNTYGSVVGKTVVLSGGASVHFDERLLN